MRKALLVALLVTVWGCASPQRAEPDLRAAADASADVKVPLPVDAALPDLPAPGADSTVLPPSDCTENGCLRETSFVGDYAAEALVPYLEPAVKIENGYSIHTLRYVSEGREVLATVAIPFPLATPAGGYHIVVNAHGTSGVADACALTGTVSGSGLAGLFGARGMIGVAPDYPGLGTEGTHPYLVAASEGRAVLDAIRAAQNLTTALGVPTSGRSAIVGLSQGGHATLAAAALHPDHAPELDIRAFAVAGPASAWEESWREAINFDGPHLGYHALLIWSWAAHYGFRDGTLWAPQLVLGIDSLMESSCLYAPRPATTLLGDVVGMQADQIFAADFLSQFRTGQWSSFVAFHDWFTENRIGPYRQTAPLRIYQGDADEVIPEKWTRLLVEELVRGGVDVDYQVVPGGTHTTVAFGFVAYQELRTDESIAWIRTQLESR